MIFFSGQRNKECLHWNSFFLKCKATLAYLQICYCRQAPVPKGSICQPWNIGHLFTSYRPPNQVHLAMKHRLPLVLHVRGGLDAEEDARSVLLAAALPRDYPIHRHCFAGKAALHCTYCTELHCTVRVILILKLEIKSSTTFHYMCFWFYFLFMF